ncbi:MAG: hypothetical protein CVU89_12095 [Firmicutes bacterium HGW-Firmicutes-14]|nr:MAG: hypothetical protein CVU89_12095 [Firmicutes bacterium HGW-Firmicutes-14]
MELPDVIGFALDEAVEAIRAKGFAVDEILTVKPVRASEPIGIARVIRLSLKEGKLRVIVAYQDYRKEV